MLKSFQFSEIEYLKNTTKIKKKYSLSFRHEINKLNQFAGNKYMKSLTVSDMCGSDYRREN